MAKHGEKSDFARKILKDHPETSYAEAEKQWIATNHKAPLGESNFRRIKDELRGVSYKKPKATAAPKVAPVVAQQTQVAPEPVKATPSKEYTNTINRIDAHLDEIMVAIHGQEDFQSLSPLLRQFRRKLYKLIP